MNTITTTAHGVFKVDHTGRGILQGEHPSFEMAQAHALLGKAAAKPSVLAGNIWYVASRQENGTFKVSYV